MPRGIGSVVDLLFRKTVLAPEDLETSSPPKMSQEEFVAAGDACPHCGSREITGGGITALFGQEIQSVWGCETCGNEWIATYRLTGFIAGGVKRAEESA